MSVEYYAPDKVDQQTPHKQDELYVIASGSGIIFRNGEQVSVTGRRVLCAAGMEHRFENFSDDFATWVIFYRTKRRRAVKSRLSLTFQIIICISFSIPVNSTPSVAVFQSSSYYVLTMYKDIRLSIMNLGISMLHSLRDRLPINQQGSSK